MAKTEFQMNELWGYNFIKDAGNLYSAARSLELRFGLSPKDKMLDELCIRHIRRLADAVFEQGVNQLRRNRLQSGVTELEDLDCFKQAVAEADKK